MPVSLYMDQQVPRAISEQLRRRGVDVVTAFEDGFDEREDEEILERARVLGRVAEPEEWMNVVEYLPFR